MNVYGIIAEYNPFHNGHKYHLEKTRSLGANAVIAIMSENFVQRGEPAIMPVSARVAAALQNGVDLVLSLPLPAAISGAENFAHVAVYILNALSVVDTVSFGAETCDKARLSLAAKAVADKGLDSLIVDYLKDGRTYAKARQAAVHTLYGEDAASILSTPNNILAVEYIKAMKSLNSNMRFTAIKRKGALHDSFSEGAYKSASQIRDEIYKNLDVSESVPKSTLEIINAQKELGKMPPDKKKFEVAVLSELRRKSAADFRKIFDISEGLENKLYKAVRGFGTLNDVIDNVKSKRYTHSRIRRLILNSYLGVTSEYTKALPPYAKVLGFNEKGQSLLSEINRKTQIPVITRSLEIDALSEFAKNYYKLECTAIDLYSLLLPLPDECGKAMTDGIIKI
ncbi:MAG TPA: nucleotidyltransferase family protein [Oscillospiraceae bacterium]|nr:nucleotidyltransferase family protein [Oscillospiraceae bacterium]